MGRDQALGQIDDYFLTGAFEMDLARRITFRTESNLEGCEDALQGYLADELVPYLSSMDFDCTIHPNPRSDAGPILVARRQTSKEEFGEKTILKFATFFPDTSYQQEIYACVPKI